MTHPMGDPEEPRDPDLDAVPMAAEALDGQVVVHVGDGEDEAPATFCLTAGSIAAYGDAARRARDESDDES
jgi:hypothetical protein